MAKNTNFSVNWIVGEAVFWAVDWAVRGDVDNVVQWAVHWATDDAVGWAVYGAVRGALVAYPNHPGLQDFLFDVGAEA
jgi:hypothetical protein